MANRFIIGRGEVLTYEIPPPKSGGPKVHPYSLAEAKTALMPQIQGMAAQVRDLPVAAGTGLPRWPCCGQNDSAPSLHCQIIFSDGLVAWRWPDLRRQPNSQSGPKEGHPQEDC